MNFRTTILLLVLLIIVAGSLYFIENKRGDAPTPVADTTATDRDGEPLHEPDAFPADAVAAITIEHKGTTIEIVREGDDWQQTAPTAFPLTSWSTEQIGKDAAGLHHVERFTPGRDDAPALADIGLEPPVATVTFRFKPGENGSTPAARTIRLGDRLAIGGRGYAMVGGSEGVYVINDALHKQILGKKPEELRKKSFDAPEEGKSDRVLYTRDGRTLALLKADGNWAFGGSDGGRVDKEKVKTLLTNVGSMYISEFIADEPVNLADYGLDEPQITVAIRAAPQAKSEDADGGGEGEQEQEEEEQDDAPGVEVLRIGGPVDFKNEHFFATRSLADEPSHVIFTVAKYFVEKFTESVDDFRDARITPLPSGDMREVVIERNGATAVRLVRSEGSWRFGDPDPGYAADSGSADRLVGDIVNARADAYQAGVEPAEDPMAQVTLAAIGRPEPDVLRLYAAEQSAKLLVVRNRETTGYVIDRDDLKRAFEPTIALRERRVLELPRERLNHVVVSRADGESFAFARDVPPAADAAADEGAPAADAGEGAAAPDAGAGEAAPSPEPGPWSLADHDRFEADALQAMIGALLPLRAEHWYEPPAPLEQPTEVTLSTAEGAQATIRFDVESAKATVVPPGAEVAVEGFELSTGTIEKVDVEFRYRTILELDADAIASVRVVRGEEAVVVERDEDGDYTGPEGIELDDSAAGGLFDTLAGLQVKRFLPAQEPPDEAPTVLVITPRSGDAVELTLFGAANVARLGDDRWFSLDADDTGKLTRSMQKSKDDGDEGDGEGE